MVLFERPVICGAIMEKTPEEFLHSARKGKELGADCLEVRADSLEEVTGDSLKTLLEKIRTETELPVILTCRTKEEGGLFEGSEDERIQIIKQALPSADLVDIELRIDEGLREEIVKEAKDRGKDVICSYHSFDRTPGHDILEAVFDEEFKVGADIAKVAVKANGPEDVLTLLDSAGKAATKGSVCAISMGPYGRPGRAMAPFFGSVLNYGYVTHETGPGQLSVKDLRTIFDIMGL